MRPTKRSVARSVTICRQQPCGTARWRGPLIAAILLIVWLAFGPDLVNWAGLLLLRLDGPPPGLELEGQLYYTQGFNGLWRHDLRTGTSERWWLPEAGSLVSGVAAAPDGSQLALAWAMPGTGGFQPGTTDLWLTSIPKIEPRPLLTRADSLESWRDPFLVARRALAAGHASADIA